MLYNAFCPYLALSTNLTCSTPTTIPSSTLPFYWGSLTLLPLEFLFLMNQKTSVHTLLWAVNWFQQGRYVHIASNFHLHLWRESKLHWAGPFPTLFVYCQVAFKTCASFMSLSSCVLVRLVVNYLSLACYGNFNYLGSHYWIILAFIEIFSL